MVYLFVAGVLALAGFLLLIYYALRWRDDDHHSLGSQPVHTNDTKYDSGGFGLDGYDADGYNRQGYNRKGKNRKGQYNRMFDTFSCKEEGFCELGHSFVALSSHAILRFHERMGITERRKMERIALDAFRFGKSKRQIKKSSAYWIEEMERNHDNGIVLIYHNYIYVFTQDRVLKTLFPNDRIEI